MPKAKNVHDYIASAPPPARRMLKKIRAAIKAAAPEAEEKISYGMPYYHYHGRLIYFAGFTHHVSLFTWRSVMTAYAKEVKKYRTTSATLQFPIGTKIPVALVKKLVKARMKLNKASAR